MKHKVQLLATISILIFAIPCSVGVSAERSSTVSPSHHSKCPVIAVSCPTSDQPFIFTVSLYDADSHETLSNSSVKYCWTLSKGKFASGQGTNSITVDASSTDMRNLTATVDVAGLDSECNTKASCSTSSH
jgi:hypothetical protein